MWSLYLVIALTAAGIDGPLVDWKSPRMYETVHQCVAAGRLLLVEMSALSASCVKE